MIIWFSLEYISSVGGRERNLYSYPAFALVATDSRDGCVTYFPCTIQDYLFY